MGELYNPYPKLPKNIRQIGERDQIVKLYVEDYVNTYLKRLYPSGGQDLRTGLLLGESRMEDGITYVFADGAMEMEAVTRDGEKVEFTEEAWKKAYQVMEQMFPRRTVLGWFLCGSPDCTLSPLNYWKQHSQYFAARNQLMYLNCGLEGEEAIYTASEDGFYKLRGYCIYYERNQMMQDYMVSRKDARRVETGTQDMVTRDFRQKMENRKVEAGHARSAINTLGTACGVLAVAVLAGGVVMFNNYQKMKQMEAVIASALPEGTKTGWSNILSKGEENAPTAGGQGLAAGYGGELEVEQVPGEVYPTQAEIVIRPEGEAAGSGGAEAGNPVSGGVGSPVSGGAGNPVSGGAGNPVSGEAGSLADPAAEISEGSQPAVSVQHPQEEPAEPVQIPGDAVLYTVQSGETLYGICMERYQSLAPLEEICLWNQLSDQNRISSGQELYLPPS